MPPRKSTLSAIMSNWLFKTVSALTALTFLGGTLWAAGDYTGIRPVIKNEFTKVQQTLDQNNLAILQIRFQLLIQKQQFGGLDFNEQQEMCSIARTLGYVGVPGC